VATPGGSGALALSVRNFLEPGMALLTGAPYWGPYLTIASEDGLRVETAPWLGYGRGDGLDLPAWAAKLNELMTLQGRLLVWINDPCHNPTGTILPKEDREGLFHLLEQAAERGPVTLLLDFAYQNYAADAAAVRLALDAYAAFGARGKVLVGASMSLSKCFTLYGSRGGALVFPWTRSIDIQSALTMSCRGLFSNCPRAPQSLMLRLARDGKAQEAMAAEQRHWSEILASRARALDEALVGEGLPGVRWEGGFFVTLRPERHMAVFDRLKAKGVFVVPIPEGLRVGICGLKASETPRFARSLAEAVRA
jgi:aspartate/tyrosine/aromatic aminotransferase